jgi:hypothetical protein
MAMILHLQKLPVESFALTDGNKVARDVVGRKALFIITVVSAPQGGGAS